MLMLTTSVLSNRCRVCQGRQRILVLVVVIVGGVRRQQRQLVPFVVPLRLLRPHSVKHL